MHYQSLREANIARQEQWDPNHLLDLTFRATELAGETGEACNEIKKLARERLGLRGSRSNKAKLASELADIIICVDLVAMDEDIDLDMAVEDKFNETSKAQGFTIFLRLTAHSSYRIASEDSDAD